MTKEEKVYRINSLSTLKTNIIATLEAYRKKEEILQRSQRKCNECAKSKGYRGCWSCPLNGRTWECRLQSNREADYHQWNNEDSKLSLYLVCNGKTITELIEAEVERLKD